MCSSSKFLSKNTFQAIVLWSTEFFKKCYFADGYYKKTKLPMLNSVEAKFLNHLFKHFNELCGTHCWLHLSVCKITGACPSPDGLATKVLYIPVRILPIIMFPYSHFFYKQCDTVSVAAVSFVFILYPMILLETVCKNWDKSPCYCT